MEVLGEEVIENFRAEIFERRNEHAFIYRFKIIFNNL